MQPPDNHAEPTRAEIAAMPLVLLEFGAGWCGYCRAAQPLIREALAGTPLPHLKIEDGQGRRLGRLFRVKLWPTLILLAQDQELGRVVRPAGVEEISRLLAQAPRP